jgi:hypothetical protein
MFRGAALFLCLAAFVAAATPGRAESCFTTQSANTGATPASAGAQFRIARRVELIEWARGGKSLSEAQTKHLDELRRKVEEKRQAKRWEEAEEAVNEAMKILGIVNKAEADIPGC